MVALGAEEKVKALVISGDLFDRGINAEDLKGYVRPLFSGTGMKVVILPGNHDADSYAGGMYFGEDVAILDDVHSPVRLGDVSIFGIPFRPVGTEGVLETLHALADEMEADRTNILLFHGELLDTFFSRSDFGEEGPKRYMPARLAYFEELSVNYVLAGHFHSRFDVRRLGNGGYFVYPGSPVSVTRRETGQRKVNLFEVGGPPQPHALDTSHFEDIAVRLDPFRDAGPLAMIRERLSEVHPRARILLTVSGFVNSQKMGMTETELAGRIRQLAGSRAVDPVLEFSDIGRVMEDELFKSFARRLDETVQDEARRVRMRELAIRAMMEAAP